jgi:hypothetical protein
MDSNVNRIKGEVSLWGHISLHPHRFGGEEFRFGEAEIGHLHREGILDIPFSRSIRDALLKRGLAEQHHWLPNSGWVTLRVQSEKDVAHAIRLLRISYLRYQLKQDPDPHDLLERESAVLGLDSRLRSLLEVFIPRMVAIADR